MKTLLASMLIAQLVGQDVRLSLVAPPPYPWMRLFKVEVSCIGCSASSASPGPHWTAGLDYWGRWPWQTFRTTTAESLPDSFMTFYGCKPFVRQVWLWWDCGGTALVECPTVEIRHMGYRPASPPRGPGEEVAE